MQLQLWETLVHFRLRPWAATADIAEMYGQRVPTQFLACVERKPTDALQIPCLNPVTYETTATPF